MREQVLVGSALVVFLISGCAAMDLKVDTLPVPPPL
jgi:hypothetical protein